MNHLLLNRTKPQPCSEYVMMGLAAVGIGILLSIWVAAPALTGNGTSVALDPMLRSIPMSYNDMISRPDPFPYRTATPSFDTSGWIDYAAAAKARAQAQYGQASSLDDDPWDRQTTGRAPSRSYGSDRHSGIH